MICYCVIINRGNWLMFVASLVDAGTGPITLIDGDNTRHIFGEKMGGGYYAAGGVYLTFVKNTDGTYTITQADQTKINFSTSGKISSIADTNGNTTTFTYIVTAVTDGEGRRVDYTYNPNGNVVQIAENPLDAANKAVTTFSYDNNNNLTQVKDPNANKANGTEAYVYTYDANGNVTGVQLPAGQKSSQTYDSQNNLITWQDFNSNVGSFDYDTQNNQTESTDANVQTSAQRYAANGNLQHFTHPMSAADNLVANSSFELDNNPADNWPDNWKQEIQTGTTAAYAWSTTSKFGNKAVGISNPTGWALVSSELFPYSVTDKYVVSAYVKTSGITNTAVVKLAFFNATGGYLGEKAAYQLKGTHDWTRIQAVIDSAPAGTTQVKVSVGLNAGSGTVYFDGIQLEKGTVLSAYNHVENSSFERNAGAADKVPSGWSNSGNLSANDGIYQNAAGEDNVYRGTYSFKLTGEKTKNKFIKQRLNLSGDATTPLTLSGWSKQVGADVNGGYYNLQVQLNYTDGTAGTFANHFSKTAADWQHVAAQVKPAKAFNSVDVFYLYYDQLGTAWFDAMRLEVGASHTFNTYDAGGNYLTEVDDPV
ncbi:hypothetical protein PAAL109150_24640 [Paenibacillus alkaliterrae]